MLTFAHEALLSRRRVVTGLNDAGQSAVIIDGPVPVLADISAALVWQSKCQPADNSGTADTAEPYTVEMLHNPGSTFAICTFPPNSPAHMHATDTIDYLVILSGQVTLVTEKGEADLGPGDFVVDRGVVHGWRNPHEEPCVAVAVNIPAAPVGAGRTV
jgi:mannose-6-phosphate isomerase-like protein (cupin superfamily)